MYATVSAQAHGRTRLPTENKRSKPILIKLTQREHEHITASAAARGMTMSEYVRTACALFAVAAPARIKKPSALRPGGSKWLWARVREELSLWEKAGCEGKFQPLHPMNLYVKEITNKKTGTHLNSGEAEDLVRDFLYRESSKIDRLVATAKKHWTRQNRGRTTSDSDTDDQTESID